MRILYCLLEAHVKDIACRMSPILRRPLSATPQAWQKIVARILVAPIARLTFRATDSDDGAVPAGARRNRCGVFYGVSLDATDTQDCVEPGWGEKPIRDYDDRKH